ncbi:EAL domain-containing protein [Paenibacillus sp. CC-CFT747]|nr:EAL domain-containing protein [Paenibacillus sp. CC-CFT747]
MFAADIHGCFTRINKQAEALTGYTSEELKGIPFTCLFPERVQTAESIFSQVIQGKPITKESRICRKDGTYAAVLITALPIIVRDKQLGVYGIIKDITEKTKTQELIQHLAYQDELTGLPNRRAFHLLVEERLAQVGPASAFALFFLDLDRFKKVNDLFGHGFGDLVIREAAAKLRACVPAACSISRMGGDEFTVFVPLDGGVSWQDIAAGIASEFSRPFPVRRQEVKLTTSIGISFWPKDGETAETLIRHADMAMYEAKADGANGYRTYERKMEKTDLEQILLENDLQQAIEDGELTVYYQPKMDTSQGIRIGWEALVRWNHPKRGLIPPGKFIPLAEETGLIVALEREVLRQVCRQLSLWSDGEKPVLPVSINFSQLHLIQSDLYESVVSVVKEHGVDPRLLEIEITESAAMHKEEEVIRVLMRFKEEGIAVSLDDFGTGYSSLSYLKRLPVDCLKIDCSFIRDIATNADSRAIVRMMVTLAAQLGFQVVAEGVETEEQVKLLAELDCVRVQGYLYGKPAPPEFWQPGHDAECRQAG